MFNHERRKPFHFEPRYRLYAGPYEAAEARIVW
jgi:hypothetical protein